MHPNPAFRATPRARNLAFARDIGFGTLAVNADTGPLLSHVPFLIDDAGGQVDLHLVRSNPILKKLGKPQPGVIAVTGGDGYISPDWYGVPDQVPTWNYVAVHLHGPLRRLPDDELRPMLDRLSAHFEAQLAPKPPWTADKMTPDVLDRMMRMIVPCRMTIEAIDGTWKLGQNKPDSVRLAAADALQAAPDPLPPGWLAELMRDPPAT